MNEHRGSTSEGIWIGLCVLLLLVTAAAGAFGIVQFRRSTELAETNRQLLRQLESEMERSLELSQKAHVLTYQLLESEQENQKLRHPELAE